MIDAQSVADSRKASVTSVIAVLTLLVALSVWPSVETIEEAKLCFESVRFKTLPGLDGGPLAGMPGLSEEDLAADGAQSRPKKLDAAV